MKKKKGRPGERKFRIPGIAEKRGGGGRIGEKRGRREQTSLQKENGSPKPVPEDPMSDIFQEVTKKPKRGKTHKSYQSGKKLCTEGKEGRFNSKKAERRALASKSEFGWA